MFHVSKESTDDLNALPILLFPDDRCLESLYILAKGKKFRGRNKIKNRWEMLLFENIDRETPLFVKYMFENLNIPRFGNLNIWNNEKFWFDKFRCFGREAFSGTLREFIDRSKNWTSPRNFTLSIISCRRNRDSISAAVSGNPFGRLSGHR